MSPAYSISFLDSGVISSFMSHDTECNVSELGSDCYPCCRSDNDQSRVPYSKRKPAIDTVFLDVSVPFHCELLKPAVQKVLEDVERLRLQLEASQLHVPVLSTDGQGTDLRKLKEGELLPAVLALQAVQHVHWPKVVAQAVRDGITHVIDFGPSLATARMTASSLEGLGVPTISGISSSLKLRGAVVYPLSQLLRTGKGQITAAEDLREQRPWIDEFGPVIKDGMLKKDCWGKSFQFNSIDDSALRHFRFLFLTFYCLVGVVSTKFTIATGKPPLMVAGMTPTTSLRGVPLVAAVSNAGYFVELAGGGLISPPVFRETVHSLMERLDQGLGIAVNILYLNARQWAFQFPMCLQMRREGVPIVAITIAAGIPTSERAASILSDMQSAGIHTVGFKPGSLDSIFSVLYIARAHPDMQVLLQWTGGRAGGHHSAEDLHRPLLEAYGAIRRVPNVILVVGSGFGDAEGSLPYLTGQWSTAYGHPPMPCDCVLMGSRMMVAKEAATADAVKQLIVDTNGVQQEQQWERSYTSDAGGVCTVKSELGEAIHKIYNRGMACWRDFDERYFAIEDAKKREATILSDREYIIQRLNSDFQKPYFGCTANSQNARIVDMTYKEVLDRMLHCMFVRAAAGRQEGRWIHSTYRTRVILFLKRTVDRFYREQEGDAEDATSLVDLGSDPSKSIADLAERYPAIAHTLVTCEDSDYFIHICKTGGKPVNFIPVIDKELATWFKKDSLWYSEDLEAVPDCDPGRVCVLQGPVAVRYSKEANQPAKDILNSICDSYVELLEKAKDENVPDAASAAPAAPENVSLLTDSDLDQLECLSVVAATEVNGVKSISFRVTRSSGDERQWLNELLLVLQSDARRHWLHAFLLSDYVAVDKLWRRNPMHDLLAISDDNEFYVSVSVNSATNIATLMEVHNTWKEKEGAPAFSGLQSPAPLTIESADGKEIVFTLSDLAPATGSMEAQNVPLEIRYTYLPSVAECPIHQQSGKDLNSAIKRFYYRLWIGQVRSRLF